MQERKIPDARWINRQLDIRKVAIELGIRGCGKSFHCWRTPNHANGDADPSVRYWAAANRLKCFVCDRPAIGVIDTVMDYLKVDFAGALDWIAGRFSVPRIPARKPTVSRDKLRLPVNNGESPIEFLIRSHLFSRLSPVSRIVAPVLISFAEKELLGPLTWKLSISYRGIARYSGLKSPNAVRKALEELALIGWLHPVPSRRLGVLRETGLYRITPYSDELLDLGNSLAEEERLEIEYEKACSKCRRMDRQRLFRERQKA